MSQGWSKHAMFSGVSRRAATKAWHAGDVLVAGCNHLVTPFAGSEMDERRPWAAFLPWRSRVDRID
ncbi:MAG: hypothetical protein ACK2T2_04715, partial [Anaerolineales bacterium]